ncbi:hypothetical protein [Eggerthella sinensis]|uniref:hypothetical protein n=1 Tax=Eggerthella sinensis TaxID=242230 RepID=UPI0022E02BAB|nr:hypothetical protein [Eggerthella sinensis]
MSEALNDKKDGFDEESYESKDATEALDERIAPSTPRGAEGAASPSATVSEADEEAASDDADGDSTAPAPQRFQAKRWALGIAAAAIVLCAITAGVGYAAGCSDPNRRRLRRRRSRIRRRRQRRSCEGRRSGRTEERRRIRRRRVGSLRR